MVFLVGQCYLSTGQTLMIGGNKACRPVCKSAKIYFRLGIEKKWKCTFGFA